MALITCKECGKEISSKAEKCPNCGCPVNNVTQNMNSYNMAGQVTPPLTPVQNTQNIPGNNPSNNKNTGLGIAALVLSVLGCTFWLAIVLAIIDLCQKNGRKKTCSVIALVVSGIWLVIGIAVNMAGSDKPEKVGDINVNTSIEADNSFEEEPKSITEESESITVPSETVSENKETVFKKGEIAELNGVQVTLTDYEESTGSDFNTPDDGNVFLLAEFEITNNTEKELVISSLLSFDAYADDYVLDFSLSALIEKDGNQLDGTIAAGKKMKGWIGWEVPKDYQNIEIHFTDNVWSDNKFIFLIENK